MLSFEQSNFNSLPTLTHPLLFLAQLHLHTSPNTRLFTFCEYPFRHFLLPKITAISFPIQLDNSAELERIKSHLIISWIQPMKQLIRRLSGVADSSHYMLLRSDSQARRRIFRNRSERGRKKGVPVYVGEEMERYVVAAEVMNHPLFMELLHKSAQVYGYDQKGVIRIPCNVVFFERVMESLRLGLDSPELHDLLHSSLFASDHSCS